MFTLGESVAQTKSANKVTKTARVHTKNIAVYYNIIYLACKLCTKYFDN